MFNPKLIFIVDPDITDLQTNPACTALTAPSCSSWWDVNSQCTCSTGCITPAWTNTSTDK